MPDVLDVSPTRGNLLRLQDKLTQLREGRDLLDRKREVLMRALLDRFADAESAEQEARERFEDAYAAIHEARMDIGVDRLRWISLAPSAEVRVSVRNRSIMGVIAALVDVDVETLPIPYGPGDTDVSMDRAHQQWLHVAHLLGRLAETTVTVWRLAIELRRTQRRVNALEEVMIPRYKATIDYIANALEEKEQEEVVHAKKVKRLHEDADESKSW
jgi:V/A-type H+-transporting ATPase subunit D